MEEEKLNYESESILVVDDDHAFRDILIEFLGTLGFQSQGASDSFEALEMLEKDDFAFMLTDMMMPEMDGMELIGKVLDRYKEISIIAMTGHANGYRYVDVINNGASDFIKKPFDLGELEAKIRRIIVERNLRKELSRLSITDSLTGLYNQRHFYARLNEEVKRADRQGHPMALILLDLDNFKQYNDTHGHLAGDEVLRYTGSTIAKWIRHGVDSGYRYGGDEFAIILIDANLDVAQGIGERIAKSFRKKGTITASLGYAIFRKGMNAEGLVAEADKNLYAVKKKLKRPKNNV
jgi:diguanylate cyclase (GGDEF)-like protein